MLDISVGSLKFFKIEAVRRMVMNEFKSVQSETSGIEVNSGVSEQPFSKSETIEGAINRSKEALNNSNNSDIGVGLEGGVFEKDSEFYVFDVAAITINTDPQRTFTGESEHYILPQEVVKYLKEGKQLSEAMHLYLTNQGYFVSVNEIMQNGTIYYLSEGKYNRDQAHEFALNRAMRNMDAFLEARS